VAGVALVAVVFGIVVVFGQGLRLGASQSAPSPTPAVSATPAAVTVTSSGDMTATDLANGQTISIGLGHTLTVTLNSTYWMFGGSSDPVVLEQAGQPIYKGTSCVPGGGCGTASLRFKALAPGRAVVKASRTSCGEALACGPDQSTYSVTVIVTA